MMDDDFDPRALSSNINEAQPKEPEQPVQEPDSYLNGLQISGKLPTTPSFVHDPSHIHKGSVFGETTLHTLTKSKSLSLHYRTESMPLPKPPSSSLSRYSSSSSKPSFTAPSPKTPLIHSIYKIEESKSNLGFESLQTQSISSSDFFTSFETQKGNNEEINNKMTISSSKMEMEKPILQSETHSNSDKKHLHSNSKLTFCQVPNCAGPLLSNDLCSIHYFSPLNRAGTPTTRARFKEWNKEEEDVVSRNDKGYRIVYTFKHAKSNEPNIVEVFLSYITLGRCIVGNGKIIFTAKSGRSNTGALFKERHQFTLGLTKCVLSLRQVLAHEEMLYFFELLVDGVPFDEARRLYVCEKSYYDEVEVDGVPGPLFGPVAIAEKDYIAKYWHRSDTTVPTKRGFSKSVVTWNFTIHGEIHCLILEHGLFGGKRKLIHNDIIVYEKKLGLFADDKGDLINIIISKLPITISIRPKTFKEMSHGRSKLPYAYELFLDHVVFDDNLLTSNDYLKKLSLKIADPTGSHRSYDKNHDFDHDGLEKERKEAIVASKNREISLQCMPELPATFPEYSLNENSPTKKEIKHKKKHKNRRNSQ